MTIFNQHHIVNLRRVNILLMITLICLLTTLLLQNVNISAAPDKIPESLNHPYESTERIPEMDKIAIGAVSCRLGNSSKYNEETWMMIKSVLISAQIYQVRLIELHIFLEHLEDEQFFLDHLTETGHILNGSSVTTGNSHRPQVTIRTYSAVDIVPEKYRGDMIYHKRWRCGYVRFFFPDVLTDVDSIIHFDSDIIYTGNIRKLWAYLRDMDSQQMTGVAREREPENHEFPKYHKSSFGQIPHVQPHGINAGVLVMNLTRLRQFGFSDKICKIRDEYFGKVTLFSGQKALNILLYFQPEKMQLLPCQFNFDRCECTRGFLCQSAKTDFYGIQVVHGASRGLEFEGIFYPLFRVYEQFDLARDMDNVLEKLIKPIRNSFDRPAVDEREKCSGTLNHLLFPNFFEKTSIE